VPLNISKIAKKFAPLVQFFLHKEPAAGDYISRHNLHINKYTKAGINYRKNSLSGKKHSAGMY